MENIGLVVIGGGPAGLAAAIEAYKNGVRDILVLERERELGGILKQCIHNGFGLHIFGEELTGPEYAWRYIKQLKELGIVYKLNTTVLNISHDKIVTAVNSNDGLIRLRGKAVILAMGCRERTRGALNIPGTRPAGVYTAGTAQRFVNMEGYLPGKKAVILGSGDIGLIMARRMTLEGAKVKMVCELLPYSGGLTRNIVQCLHDFGIPLKLSHTVVAIDGRERLEGVTVCRVDENRRPIMETAEYVECDTLLLSVGLIPENELSEEAGIEIDPATSGPVVNESMETSVEGIFACGNVVHVHDLVDYVTQESKMAGRCAAEYVKGTGEIHEGKIYKTLAGNSVLYVVPQIIRKNFVKDEIKFFFRVKNIYKNINVVIKSGNSLLNTQKKLKVTPGEMESIRLSKKQMEFLNQKSDIYVELEEG